jgi:2-hydroxy-3-keto-5-methylthiopentenyl-1-phosphate phosphatase
MFVDKTYNKEYLITKFTVKYNKYFDNYLVEYITDQNEKRYDPFDTYDEVLASLDQLVEAHNDYRHNLGFKEIKDE